MNIKVSNINELSAAVERANSDTGKTVIEIANGDYEIYNTIFLKDNIEIVGAEKVDFYGTKRISIKNAEITDGIYKINLTQAGITDNGRFGMGPYSDFWHKYDIPKPHMDDEGPSLELYFGEKKMNISRYPEKGFLRIKNAPGENEMLFKGERCGSKEGVFIPSDKEFFDNSDTDNMLLIGYWNHDWATQRHMIESYDKKTGTIKVNEPYHVFGYRDGACFSGEIGGKFYVINALSQVKNPGDWYIDRIKNEIYFIPFEGQEYIDVAICENVFEAENASNIVIKNINVSRCRKSGFKFTNCSDIHIEGCRVHYAGAWGVILDLCENSSVSDCTVYNTGGGGIACSGGDRNTLKSSGNIVNNNEIHDIAYWHRTYLAAIELNGVNVIARENNIYDVPHFGIVFQGNNHIIEKNRIRNACYESNDAGAIYAGRDYTCQGTVIRYNHLEDLLGFEGRGCIGIYFDDGMCTAEVYGNAIINMPYVGVLIGGGRDFDVHDNYFFNCKIAVMFDDRLDRWSNKNKSQLRHLSEVPYQNEYWKTAYPKLYNILDDEPTLPKYNKFYKNTVVGGDGIAMTNETLERFMEHFDNTYTPLSTNTPYIWHLEKWYYLTDEM